MRQPNALVTVGIPAVRFRSWRYFEIGLAYLASYVFFDWVSFVYPFAKFGITPWNPPTGLSFALILLLGIDFLPWLFVAPLLTDGVVRGFALPFGAELATTFIIGGGYAMATAVMLSPRLQFDPALRTRQSLLLLLSVAVVSTALVAASYVGTLVAFELVTGADYSRAALRFWIGELIGITVLTPFLLIFMTRRWMFRTSWEPLGLLLLTIAALWLEFGLTNAVRFQLFYLFFLPVIWIAVRFGLEGVTAGLVAIQLSLIIAMHYAELHPTDVIAYQALMAVLAFTGLAIGVLISEQQRTQHQLQINQEALSRAHRVSTMGEFAAALAHEINQPLTAVANYARLAKRADNLAAASEACDGVISQVERAAEVVRRLRNFIRLGRTETNLVSIALLIDEAISNCHAELITNDVELQLDIDQDLPRVNVDALQIQQVIVNLVRNSVEALADSGRHDGKIIIESNRADSDCVVIRVRDNGPGFDPLLFEHASTPFITTKQDGLGLGLSLARSIVEEHGGRLTINSSSGGAIVSFTLCTIAIQKEVAMT